MQFSTMPPPFMQGGYLNPMVPYYNYIRDPSTMPAPFIPGGYTNLLIGVDQDVTMQSTVRRLHFDGAPDHENM